MPRGRHRGRRTRRNAKYNQRSRPLVKQDDIEAIKTENIPSSSRKNTEKGRESVNKKELINNVSKSKNGKKKDNSNEKSGKKKKSHKGDNRPENRSFMSKFCWCSSKPRKYLVETSTDKKSNKSKVLKTETGNEIKPEASCEQRSVDNRDIRKFSFLKKKKTPHGKVDIYSTDVLDEPEDERITCEAVELLKHVKKVTKEREEQRKKTSTETNSVLTRLRKFFRTSA